MNTCTPNENIPSARYMLAIIGYGCMLIFLSTAGCGANLTEQHSSPSNIKLVEEHSWDIKPAQQWHIRGVAFTPSSNELFSGWPHRTGRLLDIRTGKVILELESDLSVSLRQAGFAEGCFRAVAVSRDGLFGLTGSTTILSPTGDPVKHDGEARLWDLRNGRLVRKLRMNSDMVTGVAFSSTGQVATSSSNGKIMLWDLSHEEPINTFTTGESSTYVVAFSPNGKYLLSAGSSSIAVFWEVGKGKELWRFTGEQRNFTAVTFSPNGKEAVLTDFGGVCYVIDTNNGRSIHHVQIPQVRIDGIAFSPSGDVIAVAETTVELKDKSHPAEKSEIRLLDAKSWQTCYVTSPIGTHPWAVCFSKDGSRLACSADDRVMVWQVRR